MGAPALRVLLGHNDYREPGGENTSFEVESELLRSHGIEVITYRRDSREIAGYSTRRMLTLGFRAIRAGDSREDVRRLLKQHRPALAHFHNTFPLISPSVYEACRDEGIPVIQALRNYRLICPKATLLRDGRPCNDCVGRAVAWPGIAHACYQGSRARTSVVAAMLAWHRSRGTWTRDVRLFITPSDFARSRLIAGGLPADRIVVNPNFTRDPGAVPPPPPDGKALFIGRLSEEKGAEDLLRACATPALRARLRLAGSGPEEAGLRRLASELGYAESVFAGHLTGDEMTAEVAGAACIVVPSRCYETFGRAVIEAYAAGRAVVAASHGALAELVREGETGSLFRPADPGSLAGAIERLLSTPGGLQRMGAAARREYEARYTPRAGFENLMRIYKVAIDGSQLPS